MKMNLNINGYKILGYILSKVFAIIFPILVIIIATPFTIIYLLTDKEFRKEFTNVWFPNKNGTRRL